MCSELLRIPYSWGGVPIFGVGLLLAVWTVASASTLVSQVRRHGWSGETWSTMPVLLMLGAAILWLPQLFPDGLPIRGYGLMLLLGIAAGVSLAVYRGRQVGLDQETILSITIWLVVCGVIGARAFYVVEYWGERFGRGSLRETIFEVLNFPDGGLVVFGSFIGAAIAFVVLTRKYKLPLLAVADLAAPSLMVGLAIGRIGCFLNGCCYGGETDRPWAVTFPKYSSRHETEKPPVERRYSPPYTDQAARGMLLGFAFEPRDGQAAVVTRVDANTPAAAVGLKVGDVIAAINGTAVESYEHARLLLLHTLLQTDRSLRLTLQSGGTIDFPPDALPARSRPVHPTQLYSAIDAGLLAWLLWSYYPFRRRDGEVIALLLTIHPITRFLLEYIRIDEPAVFDTGLSISQNISIGLLVFAAGLWWYVLRQPRKTVWPRAA